ncbi:MAG: PD40 domain-containing protein [Gemmatimonadetes bacterium]|nr:PD40 domain-containing protein [Gemmatimonadota bacterium]
MRAPVLAAVLLTTLAPAAPAQTPAAPAPAPAAAAAPGDGIVGYYRYPTIRGNTIVFTAEGDLWTVPVSGGVARRLTSHPAEESHPAISPDGKTLAFTASYEGPAEVYTMPLSGGVPVRRTWDGDRRGDLVVGWTPDGRILYSTSRYSTLPQVQLVALDTATGRRELLPLAQAWDGAFDPATGALFFTRLAPQSSHTRRYRGGTAQSIYRWDPAGGAALKAAPGGGGNGAVQAARGGGGNGVAPIAPGGGGNRVAAAAPAEALPLTADYTGTSRTPMPFGGRIYFASDRDGAMNIWSMRPDGSDLRQHTTHKDFDLKSPAMDDGRIVYQYGADLWLLDTRTGEDHRIPVRLASDFDQLRERWIAKPMQWLTAAHLSPSGDRVVLTARGQVFVAPVGDGRLVEANRRPGVRYRNARFLPDGKSLVALSDESGEIELWRLPANGVGAATQLTKDGTILRWDAFPSPDGKWIAHTDKNQRLWVLDVATGASRRIAENRYGDLRDLAWSPDSRWLAYVEDAPSSFSRIVLYDTRTGTATPVTTDRFSSYSPTWSPDGKWLWFLSDRTFDTSVRAPWGPRQPEPFFDKQTKIYALALHPGERFPFAPKDELTPARADTAHRAAGDAAAASSRAPTVVGDLDLAELPRRLYEAPVEAGNYSDLATDGKRLLWLAWSSDPSPKANVVTIEIGNEKPKSKTVLEDVKSLELSADGKKVLIRKGDDLLVFDAGAISKDKAADARVDLSHWAFPLDPREELRQMYTEAWRLERDYYWDPAMRGLDWPAIRAKYQPLADRVTSREELSDVLGQMIAELETLHMFVNGGDFRRGDDDVLPASLGARLVRDSAAGGFRVEHIYRADPDRPERLAPLARPGVDIADGDVIVAVNGVPTVSVTDIGELLRNQAGRQVLLRVRSGSGADTAAGVRSRSRSAAAPERDVVVVPITPAQESDLRYDEWEYTRRLLVDSLSGGRIGYVHLRAMGPADIDQWYRDFYPVFNRDALIIDVRNNRGGNIESWVLEKLLRKPWMWWQPRTGEPYSNMQYAFRGPMAAIINEQTASDGEAFAEGFRRLGLGKLVGTRTWGGEIWLTSSNVLVDRGIATAAEFGVYGPEGAWLIEGHGVDPDIVVDNLPAATFAGQDAQLETTVRYLMEEIRKNPPVVPKAPPRPRIRGGTEF